jgi:hypothetical protein
MVDQIKTPRGVTADKFLDMVRAGTHDAMVELMRAGSSDPSADFYSAVRDGVREAVRALVSAGMVRLVPDSADEPNAAEGEAPKP